MTTFDTRCLAAPPEARDDDPLVSTVMTSRIVGITADASLATALRLMVLNDVRHLPVFDETRCSGLLLETDVLDDLVGGFPAERSTRTIGGLIRPAPTITTTERRSDAARSMQRAGVDAVLVTERGRLVGIVTATDLIRSLAGPAADERATTAGNPS
jgi:CBS domain-containing protein